MKILIPMLSLSPHGGNRVLTEIANILGNMGHEVKVITSNLYPVQTYPFNSHIQVEIVSYSSSRIYSYLNVVYQIPFWVNQGWLPLLNHALTFSAFLLPPKILLQSVVLIQDMDWRGVKQPFGLFIKIGAMLTLKKHQAILAANPYLANEIRLMGNHVIGQLKLGISKIFLDKNIEIAAQKRDIDFLFIGRPQGRKRLSFYIEWIKFIISMKQNIKIIAVSQDKDVLTSLNKLPGIQVCQPLNDLELKKLYKRSRFFLLASSFEGFALPPLEAMGSGCIPVITECGGPSVYAKHNENAFVLPKDSMPQDVAIFCLDLLELDIKAFTRIQCNAYDTACDWVIDNIYNANLIISAFRLSCGDKNG
ncbi:MAG: glycosyltransferase [Methylovulum sp.]|nr:glycosyltransferase [Methylovulum sp.]